MESKKTLLNKSTHLSNNPEDLNLCKGNHLAFVDLCLNSNEQVASVGPP